jgi:hypothetical protein
MPIYADLCRSNCAGLRAERRDRMKRRFPFTFWRELRQEVDGS